MVSTDVSKNVDSNISTKNVDTNIKNTDVKVKDVADSSAESVVVIKDGPGAKKFYDDGIRQAKNSKTDVNLNNIDSNPKLKEFVDDTPAKSELAKKFKEVSIIDEKNVLGVEPKIVDNKDSLLYKPIAGSETINNNTSKIFDSNSSSMEFKGMGFSDTVPSSSSNIFKSFESESDFRIDKGIIEKDYNIKESPSGKKYINWSSYDAYIDENAELFGNIASDLSLEKKQSLGAYIGENRYNSYKTVNGLMRDTLFSYADDGTIDSINMYYIGGSGSNTDALSYIDGYKKNTFVELINQNEKTIMDIDSAIRTSKLEQPQVSYRGIGNDSKSFERVFGFDPTDLSESEIESKILDKKHFVTEGFLSTSATDGADPVRNVKYEYVLYNKAGTPALDLSKLGGYETEQEILIAPMTSYDYKKVEFKENAFGERTILIHCEVSDNFNSDVSQKVFADKIKKQMDNYRKIASKTDNKINKL